MYRRIVLVFATVVLIVSVFSLEEVLASEGAPIADDEHTELMHGKPKQRTPISVNDPRLAVKEVSYALVNGHAIVEDDIDLGTIEELQQMVAANSALPGPQLLSFVSDAQRPMVTTSLSSIDNNPFANNARRAAADNVVYHAAMGELRGNASIPQLRASLGDARARISEIVGQDAQFNSDEGPDIGDVKAAAAIIVSAVGSQYRWPNGVIPYEIDGGFPNPTRVQQAIDHWHAHTDRIRFVTYDSTKHKNWIRIVTSDGCSSRVGKKLGSGSQDVNLASGCLVPQVIHELGHAIGFWHEQGRSDRDSYLAVNTANADADQTYNFDRIGKAGIDIGAFDFDSIMLYPPLAFSINGQPTMVKRSNPADLKWGIFTPGLGGTSTGVSAGDLNGVNFMYAKPASP
jgi:hypothetical protein